VFSGEVDQRSPLKAVTSWPRVIDKGEEENGKIVSLQPHRLHAVVQDLLRYATRLTERFSLVRLSSEILD
jgi:hypothetical protein